MMITVRFPQIPTRWVNASYLRCRPESTPARNRFRQVALYFEGDVVKHLPLVHRLLELRLQAAQHRPTKRNSYELLVMGLALPAESGQVVISMHHRKLLIDFLRHECVELVRDELSPFWDISAQALYTALWSVLDVVEDYYMGIVDFWRAGTLLPDHDE